ncbi:MAG: hypothetical protein LC722_01855 [Actinobacteria bacterium]|nr:hypothetical protein [Actinomycetota bacterium]
MKGSFRHVFGGEIPQAERAWRRDDELGDADAPIAVIPESMRFALQALPDTLRELRAEVRRATDLASEALAGQAEPGEPGAFNAISAALRELREEMRRMSDLATEAFTAQAHAPATGGPGEEGRAFDPLPSALRELQEEVHRASDVAAEALQAQRQAAKQRPAFDAVPAALRELRDEVRQAVDRATETLAATHKGMDAIPAIAETLAEQFERMASGMARTLTESLAAGNAEAARAFALVAREVRTLGDRQTVLREEIRLLGKRFEEMERQRRRQGFQRPQPQPRPASQLPPQ